MAMESRNSSLKMSKMEVIKSIFASSWFGVDEPDYLKLSKDNVQHIVDLVHQQGKILLNRRQCADLSSKLVKAVDSIQELVSNKLAESTISPFKPALENFYRISVKAKLLVVRCADENWWKAAVFQVQNEEAFRDILLEAGFCYNVIYEQAKVIFCYNVIYEQPKSMTEAKYFQMRDLGQNLILPASKSEVHKDKLELQSRLEKLQQDPRSYADWCLARYLLGRLQVKIVAGGVLDSMTGAILWDKMTEPEHTWEVQGSIGSGAGATGGVLKIKWLGIPCAMKEFAQVQDVIFQNEAAILAQLNHPNIVKFVCCSTDANQEKFILGMELMEMSLDKTIKNQSKSGGPFPNHVALDIIVQIARGMCYLHDHGIAHRDLKPQNVVVNKIVGSYYSVKLVDFGMSKTKVAVSKSNTISKKGVGTTIYRAPEISPKLSAQGGKLKACWFKADIYSYALTCAHILSVTEPFEGLPKRDLNLVVLKGRRPELPPTTPPALVALLKECWSFKARSRPSFLEICTRLEEIRQDVLGIVPSLPHNFQPTRDDSLSYSHIEKMLKKYSDFRNRISTRFLSRRENLRLEYNISDRSEYGVPSHRSSSQGSSWSSLTHDSSVSSSTRHSVDSGRNLSRRSSVDSLDSLDSSPDSLDSVVSVGSSRDYADSSSSRDSSTWSRETSFGVRGSESREDITKLINFLSLEGPEGLGIEKSDWASRQALQSRPPCYPAVRSCKAFPDPAGVLINRKLHGDQELSSLEDDRNSDEDVALETRHRVQPKSLNEDDDKEDTSIGIDALTISTKSLQPASDALMEEKNIESNYLPELTHVLIPKKPCWDSWSKGALLGSGSFGTVYVGVGSNGMRFAVKEVSLSDPGKAAKEAIMQLEQEIVLLSDIQHPNIVQYLGTQREEDEKLYIFLELVGKGTLASLYQRQEHLSIDETRGYTTQILCGLKYLHDRNIIHRDIKCSNILVDADGMVKLADFGMAKQVDKLDMLQSCKGSAYWMAPEVIDPKQSYNHAADIWSVGCTVLEMATGEPPFGELEWHNALWKVGHGEAPPVPEDLPAELQDFISKCLDVNVANRPDCDALLTHTFITGTPILSTDPALKPVMDPRLSSIADETNFFDSVTNTSKSNVEPHNSTSGHRSHQVKSVRTRRGPMSLTSTECTWTSRASCA